MKISKELPQFNDKKTLIAVTGFQAAVFYLAYNGIIEEEKSMRIENPKYSDKEGLFVKSGFGKRLAVGSVYEPKDRKVEKKFLSNFEKTIKKVVEKEDIEGFYIFTPERNKNIIEDYLPQSVKRIHLKTYIGNYIHAKPFDLLKIIKSKKASKKKRRMRSLISQEAKKILNKFKK